MPIPIDDVRLVWPYQMTQTQTVRTINAAGLQEEQEQEQIVYQDVIIDKLIMKRHTTGIDPFTGTDYGNAEIPKEHQYDPKTGLPIFHRYIAGTQHHLEWPHQKTQALEENDETPLENTEEKGRIQRWIVDPVTSRLPFIAKKTDVKSQEPTRTTAEPLEEVWQEALDRQRTARLTSSDPQRAEPWDEDTWRNIVEDSKSMSFTLLTPPMPETVREEMRGDISNFNSEARNKGDPALRILGKKQSAEVAALASAIAKVKHVADKRMKTPMQLRWETEHAKKVKMMKKKPLVTTGELMEALSKHMQQQKAAKKAGRTAAPKVEDMD